MSSSPDSIVIRIEILVPAGATAPTIVTSQPKTSSVSIPPATAVELTSISCPPMTAKVKVPYGTTSGVVSASGQAPLAPPYNTPPTVWAKIRTNINSPVTPTIDSGATKLTADMNGFWGTDALGTANCGPAGYGVKNRFIVWYDYGSVAPITVYHFVFTGICSDTTDQCDRFARQATIVPIPTVVIPEWELCVGGFSGDGLDELNGDWLLTIDTTEKRPFLWTATDGSMSVRLSLALPCGSKWKLKFQNGDAGIEYSMPASEWTPTGTNIFTSVHSEGLPECATLPASIVISPPC